VEIIEGHLMPDHVHMLVSIPPKISVSSFMGYLKGKSALLMSGKACEPQVQVREQEVLGRGLLCPGRRHERGHDREVHQGAGSRGHRPRQAQRQGVRGLDSKEDIYPSSASHMSKNDRQELCVHAFQGCGGTCRRAIAQKGKNKRWTEQAELVNAFRASPSVVGGFENSEY
jgi:hypothetical protein